MSIYISGPMTGLPDFNYPAFEEALKRLTAAGLRCVSPHTLHGDAAKTSTWSDFLRRDVKAMMDCSALVMLPGWENSRGAQLERLIAEKLNIAVFESLEELIPCLSVV